ncbi:MAG: hypothetical protein A3G24_20055 [Betaproteobacteria bacterium RIFCSPLOWO2_12_FULL_62_13]|nr:MAG: hypothetical protein A3G24_20055 [Betaproteobacteria bacterium RIFCSPLOWO2_12_FULL_62_13]
MRKPETRQLDLPLEFRRGELAPHAHICLGDMLVSYTIKRSHRRRAITLTIDEQGLRVGAPWRAGERAIENQLRKHGDWVLRKLAEWQQRRPPPRRWQDGETLMLLGEPLRLTLSRARPTTGRDGERLLVGPSLLSIAEMDDNTQPSSPALLARGEGGFEAQMACHPFTQNSIELRPEEIAGRVTVWLREQALACFHDRVAHYRTLLVVPAPEIRLSNARTRWGSCHPAGRIHLNWRLIQMPLRLVDYVVVHELAHLKEMNHSPRFWHTVARVLPDYAARKKEIRREGHRYLLA